MDQPIISVVIPAYNRETFIVAAIQSVQAQDIADIEIIIVDDCSTDKTVEAIQSVSDPRIRLIQHETNKGEAGARNTGVRAARGKYIAYLDSDDYWLPGKLKVQLDHMESAPVDVGGVYTLHYRLYQNGKKSIAGHIPGGAALTYQTLLVRGVSISAGSTLMFRRELFEKVGPYDETARLYVDWDWLIRFLQIARLDLINTAYAVYEKNPHYRLGAVQEKAATIFIEKYKTMIDAFDKKSRNQCLSRIYLDIARCYAENEGLKFALPFYVKAFRHNPFPSAGAWINIIDGFLGTNIISYIDSIVRPASLKKVKSAQ